MKAIIPVAGAGKRLRPFTYTQPKPLIPVAGKPILSYIVDELHGLGIDEYIFVVGYLGEKIQQYLEEAYPHLEKRFVQQTERRGSGHAVWLAKQAVGRAKELVIVFGDTILEGRLQQIIDCRTTCLAIKPVDDPRRFGVVEIRADGSVSRMVEKPRMPRSNWAMVGFYKIDDYKALHAQLDKLVGPNAVEQREVTLTDGLMALLDAGHPMHTEHVDRWFDCGNTEVLLKTNQTLLESHGYADSQLPAFDGTIVIHPVAIGKGCSIQNAIIGPYVSIGDHAVIDRAMVRDSIVGRYAQLHDVSLQQSVVGNDTSVSGTPQSLNIGDNTELSLG